MDRHVLARRCPSGGSVCSSSCDLSNWGIEPALSRKYLTTRNPTKHHALRRIALEGKGTTTLEQVNLNKCPEKAPINHTADLPDL